MFNPPPGKRSRWLSVTTSSGRCRLIAAARSRRNGSPYSMTPSAWSRNSSDPTPTASQAARCSATRSGAACRPGSCRRCRPRHGSRARRRPTCRRRSTRRRPTTRRTPCRRDGRRSRGTGPSRWASVPASCRPWFLARRKVCHASLTVRAEVPDGSPHSFRPTTPPVGAADASHGGPPWQASTTCSRNCRSDASPRCSASTKTTAANATRVAVPALVQGMEANAQDEARAQSLAQAIAQHAQRVASGECPG